MKYKINLIRCNIHILDCTVATLCNMPPYIFDKYMKLRRLLGIARFIF